MRVMRPIRFAALGLAASAVACAAAVRTASAPAPTAIEATVQASDAGVDAGELESIERSPAHAAAEVGDALAAEPAPDADSTAWHRSEAPDGTTGVESKSACNDQKPQDFLVRGNFLRGGQDARRHAIQYRTDTYGYFEGFGRADAGAAAPVSFVVPTTFMGLPVRMHRKVVPALACVEEEIKRACAAHLYVAHALAGVRTRNTYRGGEVTNHIYGIAIDVDPTQNTCCGCVPPWNDAPACKRPSKTEYDRMAMPECWVHAFERFGFYWLGHDRLRDTMHFEFLGDPEGIVRNAPEGGT